MKELFQSPFYRRVRERIPNGRRKEFARALLLAIENGNAGPRSLEQQARTEDKVHNAATLRGCFSWGGTPQGVAYWTAWYNFLENNAPEPRMSTRHEAPLWKKNKSGAGVAPQRTVAAPPRMMVPRIPAV